LHQIANKTEYAFFSLHYDFWITADDSPFFNTTQASLHQVSKRTGKRICIDTEQDSDEENNKIALRPNKKIKDGNDHIKDY
jgi:hypothetical protein